MNMDFILEILHVSKNLKEAENSILNCQAIIDFFQDLPQDGKEKFLSKLKELNYRISS